MTPLQRVSLLEVGPNISKLSSDRSSPCKMMSSQLVFPSQFSHSCLLIDFASGTSTPRVSILYKVTPQGQCNFGVTQETGLKHVFRSFAAWIRPRLRPVIRGGWRPRPTYTPSEDFQISPNFNYRVMSILRLRTTTADASCLRLCGLPFCLVFYRS